MTENRKSLITVSAGYEGHGDMIHGTGEDGGFDYHYTFNEFVIYLNKEIPLTIELCKELSLLKLKFSHQCDFKVWRHSGDRSPEFHSDENVTLLVCSILATHLKNYSFASGYLGVSHRWLKPLPGKGYGEWIYSVDKLYKLNSLNFLHEEYLGYLKNSVQEWRIKCFEDYPIWEQRLIQNAVSPPVNNKTIEFVCGYTFPFDSIEYIDGQNVKCVCHRPIFTIYLSHSLHIEFDKAEILNNLIKFLSQPKEYSEIQPLFENQFRFIKDDSKSILIRTLLNNLFNQFHFSIGKFNPEEGYKQETKTIDHSYRYQKCFSLNHEIYTIFNEYLADRQIPKYSWISKNDPLYSVRYVPYFNGKPYVNEFGLPF